MLKEVVVNVGVVVRKLLKLVWVPVGLKDDWKPVVVAPVGLNPAKVVVWGLNVVV